MEKTLAIEVTESAKAKLVEALSAEEFKNHVIRLVARKVGKVRFRYHMAVEPGEAGSEDDLSQDLGDVILRTDAESAENFGGVRLDYVEEGEGGTGFKFHNPVEEKGWDDPLAQRFQDLLDDEINPSIASHGGFIQLYDFKDNKAYVSMGGGCQGCGMAKVTLRDGVEARVRELLPEVEEIIDVTDHSGGAGPCHG